MAGITKAERERRQIRAETCDHWNRIEGRRWHFYKRDGYWGRRVSCPDCGAWWIDPYYDDDPNG